MTKRKKWIFATLALILFISTWGAGLAAQQYNVYVPLVFGPPCPPAPNSVEDVNLPGSFCGSGYAEWYTAWNNQCGLARIEEGEVFTLNSEPGNSGSGWRVPASEFQTLWENHKANFAENKPSCVIGDPQPAPAPTATATVAPTNPVTLTPTPSATSVVVEVIGEGPVAGQTIEGPSIVQWYHASSNTCGITTLDAGLVKTWGGTSDGGYHWRFSSQAGMEATYPGHKANFLASNPSCTESVPPGWNGEATATPTPTATATPSPVQSGTITSSHEYWGPTTFEWNRPGVGDHGVAVLWTGSNWVSGSETISGTWKTWSSDQAAGWHWDFLVLNCTSGCIQGFPPFINATATATPVP